MTRFPAARTIVSRSEFRFNRWMFESLVWTLPPLLVIISAGLFVAFNAPALVTALVALVFLAAGILIASALRKRTQAH